MTLYSYVLHHNTGYAPNVEGHYCTLVCCKFSTKPNWRNIVERAEKGDWILGTGGAGPKSAGQGRIVYAMKVTDSLSLKGILPQQEISRPRRRRSCSRRQTALETSSIVSSHYYYFGKNAIPIKEFSPIEKRGPGYKCKFEEEFVRRFLKCLERNKRGKTGPPCGGEHRYVQTE